MKIHLIAIGGSIMHNLALSLQKTGHIVTGSDDEIYEPARSRLAKKGVLPADMGWNPDKIVPDLDLVILGMHAKKDNPELIKAMELQIPVHSFPSFVAEQSKDKKRVVVAGSHGKTTTTSMIMHVLRILGYDFDYLVGAQLQGFETMVQLSDAPLIIIEGDEYLSSAIDRTPKIWHYRPHLSIITGVAWDHMNVFPTLDSYHDAFRTFLEKLDDDATVYYYAEDAFLTSLVSEFDELNMVGYGPFKFSVKNHVCFLHLADREVELKIFGAHNMSNLNAAYHILQKLGVTDEQFMHAIPSFDGAAKRMQLRKNTSDHSIYQDFAHAPSKVMATVKALKEQYEDRQLTACVELHTYSSLSKEFLPQYLGSLDAADVAAVFYSPHTLEMKGMPPLDQDFIKQAFGRPDLYVFTDAEAFELFIRNEKWKDRNLLLMSSGTFGGLDLQSL